MAATAFSAAPAAAVFSAPRLLTSSPPRSAAPLLPRRPGPLSLDVQRFESVRVRASSEESSIQGDELLADIKEKWDGLENKSTVLLYGGGAVVAVWLSSIVVGAINTVPLLPKLMELVGLGYTGWFVYRYLLFKSSRKELAADIETLKKKIAGTSE